MIDSKIVWKVDPIQALQNLASGIRNKILRIALNAGAAPMKAAVIAAAPSKKGLLIKAMRIKIKNYKNSNSWVAAIGASTTFKRTRKLKNKKRDRGGDKTIRPGRYQSPQEHGTKKMTGRHFMEHACNSAKSQFQQNFARKFREQFDILTSK